MKGKSEIRKEIRMAKQKLTTLEKEAQSERVFFLIENNPHFILSNHVCVYWSMDDEVETHRFIEKWHTKKNLYLPVVSGEDLKLHLFTGCQNMVMSAQYPILEPVGNLLADESVVELVIVPGIAFGEDGKRLGRGGGFYDRMLPRLKHAWKIGVGFSVQQSDHIPVNEHDIRMDEVILGE